MKKPVAYDPRTDATNEQRLMALLALTAQELPHVPHDANAHGSGLNAAAFVQLDTDPAKLEAYLRSGMRAQSGNKLTQSPWRGAIASLGDMFAPPRVRFATAFSVILLAGLVTFWQWSSRSVLHTVERSYAEVTLTLSDSLTLPWEQRTPVQGFTATAGNDSPAGRSFAQGLLRARMKLLGQVNTTQNLDAFSERYVALGEWNVLLWAAAQSNVQLEPGFWHSQMDLARTLQREFTAADDAPEIAIHISTTQSLIDAMARAPNPRTARQLWSELTRFREAFSSHLPPDPSVVTAQ
jgi:hypothetical protein